MSYSQWKVLEAEDMVQQPHINLQWPLQESPQNVPSIVQQPLRNSSSPYYTYEDSFIQQGNVYLHPFTKQTYQKMYQPPFAKVTQQYRAKPLQRKIKTSLLQEFKRIYIDEVFRFAMNRMTFFTLLFSFMFLGCIFFLTGFLTATSIYVREHHSAPIEEAKGHVPSEQVLMQGKPGVSVNMGAGLAVTAPKSYQFYKGVRMQSNTRQPSTYVQKQISTGQPFYR